MIMGKYFYSKKALNIWLLMLISTVTLPECKKIIDKVFSGFDLTLTAIPTVISPIPVSYYPFSIASTWKFNLDSIVKAESRGAFEASDLTSVKVKQTTLRLQNADSLTNLADLHSVSISLYSDTIRMPVTLVTANVPDTAINTLAFDASTSPEILPYLQGSNITYVVTVVLRRPTTHNLVVYTDMVFAIK